MERYGTLGDRITQSMKRAGLKNPDIATRLGVHAVTVSKWRSDRQIPDEEMLLRLASIFRVTPAWLRYGTEPRSGAPDAAVSVSETVGSHDRADYALGAEDIEKLPGLGSVLLQMPEHVHRLAWPFLGAMSQAGVPRAARDQAEVLLTHLSCGILTPGYPSRGTADDVQDAQDAIAFLRRLYARRGVEIPLPALDLSESQDPDAMSGAEFEQTLRSGKRKPKMG